MTMRLAIIADNALAAEAIRRLLRHAPDCKVLGFIDGRRAIAPTLAEVAPDVVLVDEMSHAASALARIGEARSTLPRAKIVLLTVRMENDWLTDATVAGVDAVIAKHVHPLSVCTLLREVVAGNVFHTFAPTAQPAPGPHPPVDLTRRELEILKLVAAGQQNGRIASDLWVTEQTVKFHLSNIYRKLGVANRTEAAHFAHVNGLLEPVSRFGVQGRTSSVPMAA
jgi:DNA-binding NarL/FixJ family response regulator